jgi:hypothetical protein
MPSETGTNDLAIHPLIPQPNLPDQPFELVDIDSPDPDLSPPDHPFHVGGRFAVEPLAMLRGVDAMQANPNRLPIAIDNVDRIAVANDRHRRFERVG